MLKMYNTYYFIFSLKLCKLDKKLNNELLFVDRNNNNKKKKKNNLKKRNERKRSREKHFWGNFHKIKFFAL
jgi:hypothetical protein